MFDKIVLVTCGVLFVILLVVLIWWLKVGKKRFIEKRCPERLESTDKPKITFKERG